MERFPVQTGLELTRQHGSTTLKATHLFVQETRSVNPKAGAKKHMQSSVESGTLQVCGRNHLPVPSTGQNLKG